MYNTAAIRFLVRLTCFVPLVGLLLLVNWVSGEPPVRRLFTRRLDAAAAALAAGKTIQSYADMSDLKPVWLEHLQRSPDVVVLGSSRTAQIPQDWFRPRSLLNLAILAGDFADSIAIFQDCLDTGKHPKMVLLELNPTLTFEEKSHVAPALAPHFRRAHADRPEKPGVSDGRTNAAGNWSANARARDRDDASPIWRPAPRHPVSRRIGSPAIRRFRRDAFCILPGRAGPRRPTNSRAGRRADPNAGHPA